MEAKKVYPDWEEGYGPCDYTPIMEALGEVVAAVESNDYQGDTLALLKSPEGKYGVLQFGWGSCSGCDALQACYTWAELQELCDHLEQSVQWLDTLEEAKAWVEAHDWEGAYFDTADAHIFRDKVRGLEE